MTSEGSVTSYIHAGGKIGVLVEVNCESDFVARTDDFKELVHDIAMHIAASDPKFVRKEDVTPEDFRARKGYLVAQAIASGKPREHRGEDRRRQDGQVLRGGLPAGAAFHQGPDGHIAQLIATKIGKLGENIAVRRFARFKVGEAARPSPLSQAESRKARIISGLLRRPFYFGR